MDQTRAPPPGRGGRSHPRRATRRRERGRGGGARGGGGGGVESVTTSCAVPVLPRLSAEIRVVPGRSARRMIDWPNCCSMRATGSCSEGQRTRGGGAEA